ncbi:hypothetical protein [Undibacterium sp. YM2]|uniref:hypothetical protein n=1 Tax=Undibacterium sp. YM2 TaxID=2058625 RepID=UPI00138A6025|nr:hypothetical protein [Undibacterium sp. YM2]
MTSIPTPPTGTSRKHLLPWIRISLLCCLMLYSLARAIDYLHQAGCAQNPGVGATIASIDLGMISAGFQWLFMLSGAFILGTWPGVRKWRRLGQASVFLVLSFCLSIVLSVWYEAEVAETCAQPGVTQPANARTP